MFDIAWLLHHLVGVEPDQPGSEPEEDKVYREVFRSVLSAYIGGLKC